MTNRHFDFGSLQVSIPQLKKNILSTRRGKHYVSSHLIGDDLKEMMLDYRDHGKFDVSRYGQLKGDDKNIINDVLKNSKMEDVLKIRIRDDELSHLIKRYDVLKGEILAGNDSKELLAELKDTVLKLVRLGKLPLKQSYQLLLELVALGN